MVGTGDIGKLLVGYQFAASFRNWCLIDKDKETVGPNKFTLSGKVDKVDLYWSTQKPGKVGLFMGQNTWWVWKEPKLDGTIKLGGIVELEFDGIPEIVNRF